MNKISILLFQVLIFCQLLHAQHNNVLFTGRFDFTQPDSPVFSHVSSSIKANFEGTSIAANFSSVKGTSYLYVIIDGNADPENRKVLKVTSGNATRFELAENLTDGSHSIEIVKINQYDTKVRFHGFEVTGGELLEKPESHNLKIEFYGDSNPAGHSAWDVADIGAAEKNGGYFTFPGITARLLGADYHNISIGGTGITDKAWSNLLDFHHLIHMDDSATGSNLWDFENFIPQAVVINVGANDYYGSATKQEIKAGWKNFITNNLRTYYPDAHIVLANSYGWTYNEPADYVHEAVEELKTEGDGNVSYLRFPWLWGQEHAVVNEHAGFANLMAVHLANVLNLPEPQRSELSTFAPYGQLSNGSFEKSTIAGAADGWRPHASVKLVEDAPDAVDGENYLEVYNTAWTNFANDASPGDEFTVSGWMRGAQNGDLGKIKLEFKDQAQKTLATSEGLQTLTTEWQQFSNSAVAPEGTWSVWVVLVGEKNDRVYFDDIRLSVNSTTSTSESPEDYKKQSDITIYPNPNNGRLFQLANLPQEEVYVSVYNLNGQNILKGITIHADEQSVILPRKLTSGTYTITLYNNSFQTTYKMVVI
jgi:hypothetical protein